MTKPVVLAILDGFGLRDEVHGNAVKQANTPNIDRYMNDYATSELRADGLAVGLPEGQMGNSEVGHLNIGAGRVVYQSLVLINKAIEERTFFDNAEYLKAMKNAQGKNLHIMGLLSDGGVHSHINHMIAMLEMANLNKVENVYVHAFLDGRDVDPKSAEQFLTQLQEAMDKFGGELATVSGRYYSMDRDKRWDRVELAYDTIVGGESEFEFTNVLDYVNESYAKGEVDEFIKPAVNANCKKKIEDGDSVICMNFRPDRAMQLAGVLTNSEYNPKPEEPVFTPKHRPTDLTYVSTMKYSDDVKGTIAFVQDKIVNTYGEIISKAGLKQLRIAETEKYPHVTFFFDGGETVDLPGKKHVLINSPKVATYDLQPEMSAQEVTDALLEELANEDYDTVILNFANPDMVGHSGNLEATIKAVETVDNCVGQVVEKVLEMGGSTFITADHGNSDLVLNDDDTPNTAHTTAPVPAILVSNEKHELKSGALSDIAPTLLQLLEIEQPTEMTGKSLIK